MNLSSPLPLRGSDVVVYDDPVGTAPSSSQSLRDLFQGRLIPSTEMCPDGWDSKRILVLPGGVTSEWDRSLNSDFSDQLVRWIKKGGRVYGSCAGAYYCTARTIFDSVESKIDKVRSISLYPGICEGPLHHWPKVVKIRWERTQEEGYVIVAQGGRFRDGCRSVDVEVLARYVDYRNSEAVVCCRKGKGGGILSCPHWEYGITHLEDFEGVIQMSKRDGDSDKTRGIEGYTVTWQDKENLRKSAAFRERCIEDIKLILASM